MNREREFVDLDGDEFRVDAHEGDLIVSFVTDGEHASRALTRDNVRELLPLLQHFAETGELPEPKL